MGENPYESPRSLNVNTLEASLPDGEEILVQIAARSFSGRDRLFRFRSPVIGKFVLTNRRVFFLSSGMGEQIAVYSFRTVSYRITEIICEIRSNYLVWVRIEDKGGDFRNNLLHQLGIVNAVTWVVRHLVWVYR